MITKVKSPYELCYKFLCLRLKVCCVEDMYRKFTPSFLVILVSMLIPTSLYAACPDQIGFQQIAVMQFGTTAAGTSGGTIATNGKITGDVFFFGGTLSKGRVQVKGPCSASVYVEFDDGQVYRDSTTSMIVEITTNPKTINLNKKGKKTTRIAAKLHLGPMQPAGFYSGTYTIRANIN